MVAGKLLPHADFAYFARTSFPPHSKLADFAGLWDAGYVVFGVPDTRWLGNRMVGFDIGWLVLGYKGLLGFTVIRLINLNLLTGLNAFPQL